MTTFEITGGHPLNGQIISQGSKNAALPILASSLLTDSEIELGNVPQLSDVSHLTEILTSLGKRIELTASGHFLIQAEHSLEPHVLQDRVRKMRASFLVLGPLLARLGDINVALPGGDAIGLRPVDIHLSGLQSMGADLEIKDGLVRATAKKLRPAEIHLKYPSVGATEHLMMTAALIPGRSVLHNPAHEPEVEDLANFLTSLGASIQLSEGSIEIEGRENLHGTKHKIISDRLYAGTMMIATAICCGDVKIDCIPEHIRPLTHVLRSAGVEVIEEETAVCVKRDVTKRLSPVEIETEPYPGFPTDMHPPLMPLLALANGKSKLTETVFEDRFQYIEDLRTMGAHVDVWGQTAIIEGVENLHAAHVTSLDIRAGVALVLAGLVADGTTKIRDEKDHIARGYYDLGGDLRRLGAKIVTK